MSEPIKRVFEIHRVYTKDVSFESPKAPAVFKEKNRFAADVSLGTKSTLLHDDFYEIVLTVTVTAKAEGESDVVYIAEVKQAGIFLIAGFNEADINPLLNSACPNILFPYAREAISDLVGRGGFPQLYLSPVNFDAIYAQQLKEQKAQ